jgi:hypothetical protein
MKNKLMEEQLLRDVIRLAKDYVNEEGITDPTAVGHVMQGVRIGMARGIEIARNADSEDTLF